MAEFYGTLQGNRGPATRMGTKASGVHAAAQSWEGSVATKLYAAPDGSIQALITAGPGSTAYPNGRTVYHGPLAELITGKD